MKIWLNFIDLIWSVWTSIHVIYNNPDFLSFSLGLTGHVEGHWGTDGGIVLHLAGESGIVVFMDDRCNTHTAATGVIPSFQADLSTVPQPDQLLISPGLAEQGHGVVQLCLDQSFSVKFWDSLDPDALVKI